MKTVTLINDELVLRSPYDREQVAAVKRIPGARWDKVEKVWRAPITSLGPVREYAKQYGFQVDDDLTRIDLPEHPVGARRVTQPRSKDGTAGLFELHFMYDPVRIKAAKTIPGAKWEPKKGCWTAPLSSVNEVMMFTRQYELAFDPPELEERMQIDQAQLNEEAEQLLQLSHARDGGAEVPQLAGELMPFQRAGVEYAVRVKKCFIADEQGLGKTVQAMSTIETLDSFPALVVCPPTLVLNWVYEIKKFFPHRTAAYVKGRKELPDEETDYLIIGWSNIDFWKKDLTNYSSYVFDESHSAKNGKAKRTRAAQKIAKSVSPGGAVLLLTGTPITNRPAEFAPQLKLIDQLGQFGGEWPFYKRYAAAHKDRWGQWNLSGASNLEELNQRLRSSCYIRRTKKEVLEDLPEVRHATMYVEPDVKVMPEYREAVSNIVEYWAARAAEMAMEMGLSPTAPAVRARIAAESNEHLVQLTALRRLAALAKLPAVHEWVELHRQEGPVVVAAHHRDVVDQIASQSGGVRIQGGANPVDVEENKRQFQAGEVDVMVLSIQAAKMGHTLTAASNILMVEQPWTPADVDQTVARLHRIGQRDAVLATHMLAEGTIDEDLYRLVESKRRVVDAATEGRAVGGQMSVGDILFSLMKTP